MAKKFNTYVAVHKDPAESVWFAPGDEVPDWALELVGDHVYGGNHEADDEIDVRLTDPQYEPDDPATGFTSPNTLPPEDGGTVENVDDEEVDLDKLTKRELQLMAQEAGLDDTGTKAELIERLAD